MSLIKCTVCGHQISNKATKCPKCGAPIKIGTTQGTINEVTPAVPNYQHQNEVLPTEKRSNKAFLYVIIGTLIAALVALGFFMLRSDKEGEQEKNVLETQAEIVEGHYELKGTIGAYDVSFMKLDISNGNVSGFYHYDFQEQGVNLTLNGQCDEDGTITLNETTPSGTTSGRFVGTFDGKIYSGTFYNLTKGTTFPFTLTINEVSDDTNTAETQPSYAGLSFRTFTESEYDESNNVTYQNRLSDKVMAENLKGRGFELSDTKTEFRPDYTGEDFYNVTIDTYSKTVNGYVTTVILESEYTEIRFPNLNDVEEFKKTVQACGLKETEDGFTDSEEVYWAGTDVSINGTTVTLRYRFEP